MTSTATEAPSETKASGMTPEHKARMAAGRARAKAEREKIDAHIETQAASADVAAAHAEIERLRAELARRPALPTVEDVAKLPRFECFFEFVRSATPEGAPIAERMDSSDDPRWDELKDGPQNVFPSLITNRLVRNEDKASVEFGKVIERRQVLGRQTKNAHTAREMMRAFEKNRGAFMDDKTYTESKPYEAQA